MFRGGVDAGQFTVPLGQRNDQEGTTTKREHWDEQRGARLRVQLRGGGGYWGMVEGKWGQVGTCAS